MNRRLTPADADDHLKSLKEAIEAIFNQRVSELSFEKLYRLAYLLVLYGHGKELFAQIVEQLQTRLHYLLTAKIANASDDVFLSVLFETWSHYQTVLKLIAEVLMYMDTKYCTEQEQKVAFFVTGIELFRLNILESPETKIRLFKELNSGINRIRERDGACSVCEAEFIKKLMLMFLYCDPDFNSLKNQKEFHDRDDRRYQAEQLDCRGKYFETDFGPLFVNATHEFYSKESSREITRLSVPQYIEKAAKRFEQEESLATKIAIPQSTKQNLLCMVRLVWIIDRADDLILNEESGCKVMFDNKDVSTLKQFYQNLSEARESQSLISDVMKECINNGGNEILRTPKAQSGFEIIEKLLKLHKKYCDIISECFGNNSDFKEALKNTFCSLINDNPKVACHLASHIDSIVKGLVRQRTDSTSVNGNDQTDNFSNKLKEDIMMLRWLEDKDVFEAENHDLAGKRLILHREASMEWERKIVEALKIECGSLYSNKLEQMCKDLAMSKELNTEFSQARSSRCSCNFQVTVLTAGLWRTPNMAPFTMPNYLKNLIVEFEEFYKNKYRMSNSTKSACRTLLWSQVQVSGDLKATFDSGAKELNLVTTSMLVLLLFNEHSELTFKQIKNKLFPSAVLSEEAKASIDEIKNSLISLCMNPSVKILIRTSENQSKSVNDEDRFSVNNAFKSKMYRTIVPHVKSATIISSIREFGEQLSPAVLRQRKFQTEAAIVKIMKTRKELKHENLVKATMETIDRFRAENRLIKECIENLIERDFLCRSKTHRDIYQYVA